MPLIEVKLWEGHDEESVKKIIKTQTSAMCEAIGCPPGSVRVIVYKVPKSHWGVGGKPSG